MNTKKLNAGIAFLCLQAIDDVGVIDDKYVEQLSDLAGKSEQCELYTNPDDNNTLVEQCIALIQEYLRSVSTDINIGEGSPADRGISIGDRVEVLEDNPEDSDNYYDKGEVGVVIHMMDNSCVVNFGQSEWDSTEIPFNSLKKIVE